MRNYIPHHSVIRSFGYSVIVAALCAATGCWTVRETARPEILMPAVPTNRVVKVQVAGFDAKVTTYVPAYGYATITDFGGPYRYGRYGRYYGGGLRTTTVSTTEFIPQVEATAAFRNRATDALERCGCLVQVVDPRYRVEVRFDGPFMTDGDGWATAGWMFLTLFTAEYEAQTWTAKMKIHDLQTGKMLLERDYAQHYEIVVWGPIPIFSPGCCEKTSNNRLTSWCLEALTDQAVTDALKFFSGATH